MERKSITEKRGVVQSLQCLIFVVIIIIFVKKGQTVINSEQSIHTTDDDKPVFNPYHIFETNGIYDRKYGHFSEGQRLEALEMARHMFQFGYDSYMKYAFPADELNPIDCTGRGPDLDNPSNININDVLGDYSLTLVDCLDTLVVMRNITEFKRAVRLVVENVNFDKDSTVQVFEANIRVMGALISAHLLIVDSSQPFGDLRPGNWYSKQLLELAQDLATRLLPAFDQSKTGLPFPRVNLKRGLPKDCHWCKSHTCTAGAGSLLLEFGILSRLTGDPVYESVARRATQILYRLRANQTGLLGNVIDVETLDWVGTMSGVGAGLDSFYEYLLKSFIMFGSNEDHNMFSELYEKLKKYSRKGRVHCNRGSGNHPLYVNVNMDGSISNLWIDSLGAAWPAIQVLAGDIEEAICSHALFYNIWRRFGVLPERFNWQKITADPSAQFYPLRPELAESTYLLYQATRNPFYLHVGLDILFSLNNYTRAQCGYATVHNVNDKSLEDRMESFFLSETCKYLYLLFDRDNPVNKDSARYLFSTEGHLFSVDKKYRDKTDFMDKSKVESIVVSNLRLNGSLSSCERIEEERYHSLPLKNQYFLQVSQALGIEESN